MSRINIHDYYCVYKHTCPNSKVYIGITGMDPNRRWNQGKGYSGNSHFYNAILKYGWDNIKHEILYSDLTKEEACEKEIELIAEHKSNQREFGYNVSLGGEIHSEETKEKIRQANLGKHHSKETREKMSRSRKGIPHSKVHSQNIANALKGRHLSEENKRHLSESKKGSIPWNKNKTGYSTSRGKKVVQCDLSGNPLREYNSSWQAARQNNLSQGNIYQCCKGSRNNTGGYCWKWKE